MFSKWHIFFGGIFTAFIWLLAPQTNPIYLTLIFLSSFLIDFDHYINLLIKTKKISLSSTLKHHDDFIKIGEGKNRKKIQKKGSFHLFHTIEFHILVALLSLLWTPFFYMLIGMIFHSLLDVIWLLKTDRFYKREFFFFNWLRKQF